MPTSQMGAGRPVCGMCWFGQSRFAFETTDCDYSFAVLRNTVVSGIYFQNVDSIAGFNHRLEQIEDVFSFSTRKEPFYVFEKENARLLARNQLAKGAHERVSRI